jgi:signal transduction histidine kinase
VELLPALEGQPAGRLISLQDCTDAVIAEDRLAHAAKLTMAGTLSAQVAHELRNPLNSLILNLEMMEEDLPARHPAAERLKGLMAQAERLERLTAKYLGVGEGRLAHGGAQSALDLGQFLEEALESRAPEFQAKGVRVGLQLPQAPVKLVADPVALQQVMDNLFTNALDAVEELPEERRNITVSAKVDAAQAIITVEDGGDGVPVALEPRLFEPFVTGKARGNGLGLTVSRQICLDHGGDLRHRGRSCFEVNLPC